MHLQNPELPMHLEIGPCLPETAVMLKALSLLLSVGNRKSKKVSQCEWNQTPIYKRVA